MMQTMKRGLALIMVLVMFVAFVPALIVNVDAAGNVTYVYSGKYIYNWGTREEKATFLSPNAEKFYKDNNTSYAELSSYSGGTGRSDAPNSELYDVLHDLMKNNHDYETSYDATRSLYQYTDCQNSGKDSKKISSFYSGKEIGPSWDGGSTWNREHTWPQSKSLSTHKNDIMMLRPTSVSENSSRGNTAYGESNSYYNPNKASGSTHDVRGDVARIFLYVYVRWENTTYAWGSSGVMESVEVLLAWMEADPVDTWELGRNDSVESITGTRNVFVDYPELAFLLFGEEVPSDMQTPSNGGDNTCGHNNFDAGVVTAPTCDSKGYTTYTCQTAGCGYTKKDTYVAAKGHNYVNDVCSICGEAKPTEPTKPTYVTEVEVGKAYKLGLFSTAKNTECFFSGTMINTYYGATDTNFDNGVDVYVEQTNGGYHLYFENASGQKQYINLVASGTHRNFTYSNTATSVFTWDAAKNTLKTTVSDEVCYIGNYGSYKDMSVLRTSYLKDSDYIARLYTIENNSTDDPSDDPITPPTCQHNYNKVVTEPNCTAGGFTTYTCTLCGDNYIGDKTAAKGHSYTNGTCTSCGAIQPSAGTSTEATISFADTTTRLNWSTDQQIWAQNGITVTNDKTSSSTAIIDSSNPVRFYKHSDITIAYPGMTKIVIACNTPSYATACQGSIGENASINGKEVTVTLSQAVDSFKFTASAGQIRVDSITVYAEAQPETPPQCEHTNTATVGAIEATCTTNGFTGNKVCQQCNTVLSEGTVIVAIGHVFGEWTTVTPATCTTAGTKSSKCNNCTHSETKEIPALGHTEVILPGKAATCTENGITQGKTCSVCDAVIEEQKVIPALGHNEVILSGKAATCTETGLTEGKKCSACDTVIEAQEVIPALGHKDTDNNRFCDACQEELTPCPHTTTTVEGAIEATCTTGGHTGKTVCTDCKTVMDEGRTILAKGHSFGEWTETTAPTCTTTGSKSRSCKNCDYSETKVVAVVDEHTNTTLEGAIAATCTTDGHTGKTICTDCKAVVDEGEAIPALGHNDANNDGACDACDEKLTQNEDTTPETPETPEVPEEKEHTCEKVNGFKAFWNAIVNFFRRLFGQPEICTCGEIIEKKK